MARKFLYTVLVMIISASLIFSQEKNKEYMVSDSSLNACENNPAYFNEISHVVRNTKQNIFAIFRAGKNETEVVNAKRLIYVKTFLQKRRGWDKLDVIYARGEKTDDEGKIKFYIGGKLFLVVISPNNKTPSMDCCGNAPDYPQNLNKMQKRNKKRKI